MESFKELSILYAIGRLLPLHLSVYKPVGFCSTIPIKVRSMKEKEYIIQQLDRGVWKKYCMDNLGMSEKAWKRYRKHAILHAF